MLHLNKKKVILIAVTAIVVCAALVAVYLTREKAPEAEAEPDTSHIAAPESEGVAGPALDELPEDIWKDEDETGYNGFTTRAQLGDVADSIGVLTIEKIGVSCNVFDSDENTVMEDMKRGAAHYKSSSYWDGNVCFSAHIGNLEYCYFDQLHKLKEGDLITYETTLGTRSYAVVSSTIISDEDWSMLGRTKDNRVTLTTCVNGQDAQRLCVQAVEVVN